MFHHPIIGIAWDLHIINYFARKRIRANFILTIEEKSKHNMIIILATLVPPVVASNLGVRAVWCPPQPHAT